MNTPQIAVLTRDELAALVEQAAKRGAELALLCGKPATATTTETWTAKQAGQYLNCSAWTVLNTLRKKPGFPEPLPKIGRHHQWLADDIRNYREQIAAIPTY